jgi:hypothetical protein
MAINNRQKKINLNKKILSNLPEGYIEDYIRLFLIENADGSYSQKPITLGTDSIKQMEQKYGEIIKTQYPKSRTDGEFLKGIRVRDINSAIRKDLKSKDSIVSSLTDYGIKRGVRLSKTAKKTKYVQGTNAFPFHHIMPIGGETRLTTNDVAIITKQMNSRLSQYNTRLNNIADDISDNISKAYKTASDGGSFPYLKKVDELNKEAEQVIATVAEKLPKKYQPYIGFTQLNAVTDEYGLPIDDQPVRENRIGKVGEKGIPIDDLNSQQLKKLKDSVKSLSEKEKIGRCSVLSRGGLPGDCAAAIDNDPVKAAKIFAEGPETSSAMAKVKSAANTFLSVAKKGGRFGAFAAVGAAGAGLVKEFMNDDPSTYLSDENQQKNMLIDMITQPIQEPSMEPATTAFGDAILPTLGAVTAGGMIPGGAEYYKDRRGIRPSDKFTGPMKPGVGKIRAAASPLGGLLGKGLAASGTPLGMLALEPLYIGQQIAEGDSAGDIATNPFNYLGAAFASPLTQQATKFAGPTASNIMRLGISPGVLKTVSRRFGLPGLALSAGISGYEMYQNKKAGRGLFDDG